MSENAIGLEARGKTNLKASVTGAVSCEQTQFASLSNRHNLVMQLPTKEGRSPDQAREAVERIYRVLCLLGAALVFNRLTLTVPQLSLSGLAPNSGYQTLKAVLKE